MAVRRRRGSQETPPRTRRAAALSVPLPPGAAEECDGDGIECRVNLWDGKVYSLRQLRKWCEQGDYGEEEVLQHWEKNCAPIEAETSTAASMHDEAAQTTSMRAAAAPQVEAWRRTWTVNSLQPMWTSADFAHLHAISGAAYLLLGAAWLADVAAFDVAVLNAMQWERTLPVELAFACMLLGALNAASGLQPALLAHPRSLPQALGAGEGGSARTGGFVNASLVYFVFLYQALRVLPSFPSALTTLDPMVGFCTVLLICHTAFILNAWVAKGKMHRIDALVVPSAFNLPVSFHLMFGGQAWIDQLAAAHPGWPDLFFTANFALGWAACAVTFVLSLHERRVISWELRGILMVALPLLVFPVIPLHAASLAPGWLDSGLTMLTLSPPVA